MANVQTKGIAGGSVIIFDLVNRGSMRAHRLKLRSGGIDAGPVPLVSYSPSSSMSEYTNFSTFRPVSFDDFEGAGARLISVSGLMWSWSSLTLWEKSAYLSTGLAWVRMSGWGAGLPGGGLDHGVVTVVYGDGKPLGDVEAVIEFNPPTSPETLDSHLHIKSKDDSFVVVVQGDIQFAIDKSEIRPEANKPLEQAAAVVRSVLRAGGIVSVNGHADDTGGEPHNVDLSRRRAAAVAQWFTVNKSLPGATVRTQGFGSLQPLMYGKDKDSRTKNRRVEIYVKNS